MNLLQLMPMITGFVANPEAGLNDLQKQLIPAWKRLEQQAGGSLIFVFSMSEGEVIISLYKVGLTTTMQFLQAFSPYGFFQALTNQNFTLNADKQLNAESTATESGTEAGNGAPGEPGTTEPEPGADKQGTGTTGGDRE